MSVDHPMAAAAIATVVEVRKERSEMATTLGRNWTALLTVVPGAALPFAVLTWWSVATP